MMSYRSRFDRRGALTEAAFLEGMRKLGFLVTPTRPGEVWAFEHDAAPGLRFVMANGENYSAALARLRGQIAAARQGAA